MYNLIEEIVSNSPECFLTVFVVKYVMVWEKKERRGPINKDSGDM